MNTYKTGAASLIEKLKKVAEQTDSKLSEATQYLLFLNGSKPMIIELEDDTLRIGEFETLINGYAALERIGITEDKLLLETELMDCLMPITQFDLSIHDKLSLLEVLENKIVATIKKQENETT